MRDIISALGKSLSNDELEAHGKKLKKKRDADAHKQHVDRQKDMWDKVDEDLSQDEWYDHYNFYVDDLEDGEIPLSFDEWKYNHGDDLLTTLGMNEDQVEESFGHNFTALDLKKLEGIKNLDQLKDKAFELISNPDSGAPMKPEKVAWFKNRLTQLRTPNAVIKMMWDMLLSGEGHGVIGQKHTMGRNSYRQQFGEEEQLEEAPTMDTTQLVTMLKNAGLTEDAIQEKLNEWGNTPEGVGEVEPTAHGDAYDYAEGVNLSLKRYLDAQDMKVGIAEHKVEDMKALYEEFKADRLEEQDEEITESEACADCGESPCVCEECNESIEEGIDDMVDMSDPEMDMEPAVEPELDTTDIPSEPAMDPALTAEPEMDMDMGMPAENDREETKADLEVMALRRLAGLDDAQL